MIGKTNGKRAAGAVSGEKYYIATTYPAGSICTCTNGIYTFTAEDTSGVYVYTVPSTGDWTVSSTDGVSSRNKTINISNMYTCELAYTTDYLYKDGIIETAVTGGLSLYAYNHLNSSGYTPTADAPDATFANNTSDPTNMWLDVHIARMKQTIVRTNNKVDLTPYSTITINLAAARSGSQYWYLGIIDPNATSGLAASRTGSPGSSFTQYSLDVSNYNGEYYICFATWGYETGGETFSIHDWLIS